MRMPSKNRRKGKTDRELRDCLSRLLEESEELRDRFAELQESIPPSSEELAGEPIPPEPDLGTEIRITILGGLRDYLDPLIAALIRVTAYEPPHGCRG
jgi:hypothetical protein